MFPQANGQGNDPAFDCDAGCDLGAPPVCGKDDLTYNNECLAVCQGVEVARPGACPGQPPVDQSSYVGQGFVENEKINRFQGQGYKYVARRVKQVDGPGADVLPEATVSRKDVDTEPPRTRPVIFTEEGDEYLGGILAEVDFVPDKEPLMEAFVPPDLSEDTNGGERNLQILGADTRVQITYPSYPDR